jgi:pimeloyl-ACP methyl ester carboxylesterase
MPTTKVNGLNINYTITGQGEPLVMIMGLGGDQSGWMFQAGFFKKYYRVVTFDNRGVGNSDKPGEPYSIRMMADDTVDLMDYLGVEKAHILGMSMGGMIAQELAINYPARVLKLVLASTLAYSDDERNGPTLEFVEKLELPIQSMVVSMTTLAFNRLLPRMLFMTLGAIQQRRMGTSGTTGFLAQKEACRKHDTSDRLSLIKAPTLVIVGTKDRVIKPSSSEVIAELLPNSKLVKFQNGSHVIPIEMSVRFNKEVLDFLKDS